MKSILAIVECRNSKSAVLESKDSKTFVMADFAPSQYQKYISHNILQFPHCEGLNCAIRVQKIKSTEKALHDKHLLFNFFRSSKTGNNSTL